jgi:hypothetical protein
MKNGTSVSAIPFVYYVVITTIVYALLATIFLQIDNANGEEETDIRNNDSATANSGNKTSVQELGDPHCKSPCPSDTEMCVQMCA